MDKLLSDDYGDEVDWAINQLTHIASSTGDGSNETQSKIKELLKLIDAQKRLYAERERAIAEYQLAEKLYGDVTNIYLFKDGGDINSPILKENADDHARELLKDCERHMNDNSKVYSEYINELRAEQRKRVNG